MQKVRWKGGGDRGRGEEGGGRKGWGGIAGGGVDGHGVGEWPTQACFHIWFASDARSPVPFNWKPTGSLSLIALIL